MNAGIYIHVPFCAVRCPYCDFYSVRYSADAAKAYTDAVCRNLNALPEDLTADTLYLGGGTPSLLKPDMIAEITATAKAFISKFEEAEISLEANPLTVTKERAVEWRKAGINRLSLGVQSFSEETLRTLGRKHSPAQARQAVQNAVNAGITNLSIDLMIGLKHQDLTALRQELESACALPVTHISVYLLKIEPETPFGQNPPALLTADETADLYLEMDRLLTGAGFEHYEISNFAKPGFASRHNSKYWRCLPYYGIGPGAHSCCDGRRFAVTKDLNAFLSADIQPMNVTDGQALTDGEQIMLGLRLKEGIYPDRFPDVKERLMKAAKPLLPQYLTYQNNQLAMTPTGWLVSNSVLAALLRDIP